MKKLILALALLFVPSLAFAQCTGVFPANNICGSIPGGVAGPVPVSSIPGLGIVNNSTTITGAGTNSGGPIINNAGVVSNPTPSSWFDSAYCNTVGYIIVRLSGAWTCSNAFPLNVVWFGADPTGATDSTTAVNAVGTAINAAGGGQMYFPHGTYLFVTTGTFSSNTLPIIITYSHMNVKCDNALLLSQAMFGGFNSSLFTPANAATDYHIDGCRFRAAPAIAVTATFSSSSPNVTLTSGTTAGFFKYMWVQSADTVSNATGKFYVNTVVDSTHFTLGQAGSPANASGSSTVAATINYSGSAPIGSRPNNTNWSVNNITCEDLNSANPTGLTHCIIAIGTNYLIQNIQCTYTVRVSTNPYDYAGEDCVHQLGPSTYYYINTVQCNPCGDDGVAQLIEDDQQVTYDLPIQNGGVVNVSGVSKWAQIFDQIVSVGMAVGTINNNYIVDVTGIANDLGSNTGSSGINIYDKSNRAAIFSNDYSHMQVTCTNTALDCVHVQSANDLKFNVLRTGNAKLEDVKFVACTFCTLTDATLAANQTVGHDLISVDNASGGFQLIGGTITNGLRDGIRTASQATILGVNFQSNAGTGVTLSGAVGSVIMGNSCSGNVGKCVSETGSPTGGSIINDNNIISGGTISTTGTLTVAMNNIGYNPVGVQTIKTVGASPATICAGSSAETHYYSQTATFTAVVSIGGLNIGTTTAGNDVTVVLGPHECDVVTWVTTAPQYAQSIH